MLTTSAGWGATKKTTRLSLEQFTQMALNKSLRSRANEDSLSSAGWSWLGSRRRLSWPTLTATASESKSFSDNDVGTETTSRTDQAALTFSQPMLTGTVLSLGGTWTNTPTESETLGIETLSRTREVPSFTASINQPLFIFVRNSSLRSKKEVDLSYANNKDSYQSERLAIEKAAKQVYYNLFLQSQTMLVEMKKYESAKLVNDATRALVRAGKLAEVELVRSEIRSKTDLRRIQNAKKNLEKTQNQANDLIAMPLDQTIEISSQLKFAPLNTTLDQLIQIAVNNNQGLLIGQRRVELSEISLNNTKEANNPTLNASGTYRVTRDRSNAALPVDPNSWIAGVGLEWPLLDAAQTKSNIKQAEFSLQSTKRDYENQFRQLKVDIENTVIEIERIADQIMDFEPQKKAAEKNVAAIRLQYRNGLTRLTDVFDAENQLRDLELENLSLLVDFNNAKDTLKVLLGRDL